MTKLIAVDDYVTSLPQPLRQVAQKGRMDVRGGMGHIRLRTTKDIDPALFTDWLHQARELELSVLAKPT